MIEKHPLVSVIIPCYNHENFVQDCIQSVIDQDYQNIELIIIDDGSKDSSVQKIEEMMPLCKERFTRFEFRHRPNQGLCNTLNEGLKWVEGEYLCSVASDDIWLEEKTSLQVKYLNENPETVAVFGNMTLINEHNTILEKHNMPYKRHTFDDIFLHQFYIPTPTNMARTKAIKNTGGYPPNLIIEDWYMWLKLAETNGYLDCLPNTFAYYRRHGDNLSGDAELMLKGKVQIVSLYKSHSLYKEALKKIYLISIRETQSFNYSLFKNAIYSCPSLMYSLEYWKKALKLLKRKLKNLVKKKGI